MMRSLIILVALFLAVHANTECLDSAPFDCPEGTHCSSWNDGCNECACSEDGPGVAMCSMMMCPCLEDNSCTPTCNDNPECTPKKQEEEEAAANSIFACPEGTTCMSWNDGCNECFVGSPDQPVAGCTEMYCPCYDDNSCVPTCKDNAECVPANANKLESGSGAADVLKLWLGLFLAAVVGYGL